MLLSFSEERLTTLVEARAGGAEPFPKGIVEFLAGRANGAQLFLHFAEGFASRFPLLRFDQRFCPGDDRFLGDDAFLGLFGNRGLHRGQARIEHGPILARLQHIERVLQCGQPIRSARRDARRSPDPFRLRWCEGQSWRDRALSGPRVRLAAPHRSDGAASASAVLDATSVTC